MKTPTLRRSGRKHTTVLVSFHPNRDDVQYILARHFDLHDDIPNTMSTRRIAGIVRDYYEMYGTVTHSINESLDPETDGEVLDAADRILKHHFPDWT